MLMLLTIVFISLAAVALMVLVLFGITPEKQAGAGTEAKAGNTASRFFANDSPGPAQNQDVPVEVLLSQIQRHVRLEQAAAESFVQGPNAESLRSRTASPLAN